MLLLLLLQLLLQLLLLAAVAPCCFFPAGSFHHRNPTAETSLEEACPVTASKKRRWTIRVQLRFIELIQSDLTTSNDSKLRTKTWWLTLTICTLISARALQAPV
jgi:hypothetical protein